MKIHFDGHFPLESPQWKQQYPVYFEEEGGEDQVHIVAWDDLWSFLGDGWMCSPEASADLLRKRAEGLA